MSNALQTDFRYTIKAVKQPLFFANESLSSRPGETIYSSMNVRTGINREKELVNLTIRVWYHYQNETTELAATEVENIYHVENLKNYIGENDVLNLPAQIMIGIVGMAISHARALFSSCLASTVYQEVVMAIINPHEATVAFFPHVFEQNNGAVSEVQENKTSQGNPPKKRNKKAK